MSVFIDLSVRKALGDYLLGIGTSTLVGNERSIDLSPYGFPSTVSNSQIVAGEIGFTMDGSKDWIEPFLTKSPQFVKTPSETGLSYKKYQYVVWVKTDKNHNLNYNEALSGAIEDHFYNNLHIPVGTNILTILKTFQHTNISIESNSGRFHNKVTIECEIYYNNK